MAPIRRYLRITKFSVLETRIYLDNPALAQSWLLNPRDPILPKVIESVRPLVLPKLREEQERSRNKKGKVKSIKDVVVEDDFEVSIFLTQTETRHSLLYKHKIIKDRTQTKLTSNSSRLTGGDSLETPIDVEEVVVTDVPILREEDDDDQNPMNLDDIPDIREVQGDPSNRRPKRRRQPLDAPVHEIPDSEDDDESSDAEAHAFQPVGSDPSDDDLFVANSEDNDGAGPPPPKRRKETDKNKDDKKKLAIHITHEAFAIYGRVLCLVVKRRDVRGGKSRIPAVSSGAKTQLGRPGGQAMMENWISSTQLPEAGTVEDEPI